MGLHVFTIGHSNHSAEHLLGLLALHDVTAVADVRSTPFSQFAPQFNRPALKARLDASGIGYVFLGAELGARSKDPSCYEDGKVQYRRLAAASEFQSALDRVIDGAGHENIALLCTEKDPLECHRTVLVATELRKRGVAIDHILGDGRLEGHDAALQRLLDGLRIPPDLFSAHDDLVDRALAEQESRIAYVDPAMTRRDLAAS